MITAEGGMEIASSSTSTMRYHNLLRVEMQTSGLAWLLVSVVIQLGMRGVVI